MPEKTLDDATAHSNATESPEMGRLAATLAHEIRNPLTAISTRAEILRGMVDVVDPRGKHVDAILDEVERLERLVSAVLRFSRDDELDLRPHRVASIVDGVMRRARERADAQRVTFDIDVNGAVAHVDCDLLERALTNLVENALDELAEGGRVRVCARELDDDAGVAFSVEDSGRGIPADKRASVLTPFFTSRARGVGLGLPFAHQIVTRHGGSFEIADSTLGGAAFRFAIGGSKS